VPILGIVTFAAVVVLGLGAATMALLGALRRENPRPKADWRQNVNPPPAAAIPVPPPGAAYASAVAAPVGDAYASTSAPPVSEEPGLAGAAAVATGPLILLPKAEFLDRAAAFGLDLLLVMLTNAILDFRITNNDTNTFFLMLLVYHIAFWTWKGTTVGCIICNLRVIRIDGAPLQFSDALVRGLSSIFSLAVVGLGAFWILRDPERQSWHDRIAGTYVVKVPRGYPLP
jgi:uncharacterized RDD family membrane protein YckC